MKVWPSASAKRKFGPWDDRHAAFEPWTWTKAIILVGLEVVDGRKALILSISENGYRQAHER